MPRKKRSSSIATHKQKIDPVRHQKLSWASKRRRRVAGMFASGRFKAAEGPMSGKHRNNVGVPEGEIDAAMKENYRTALQRAKTDPNEQAFQSALNQTYRQTGQTGRRDHVMPAPLSVSRWSEKEAIQAAREQGWRDKPGVYAHEPATRNGTKRQYIPPSTFEKTELSPSHRAEIERMTKDPDSVLNRGVNRGAYDGPSKTKDHPTTRRRKMQLFNKLQEGYSHQEAVAFLDQERRGGGEAAINALSREIQKGNRPAKSKPTAKDLKMGKRAAGNRTKTHLISKQRPQEFSFGLGSDYAVDKTSDLKKKFVRGDNETEQDYGVRLAVVKQNQRELVGDLLKNQAWAHETRRANILGEQDTRRSQADGPDRVTIFTTSLGKPSVTLPSDSLVGQYIIRRRKKVARELGLNTRSQLKGRFPQAVRDQHIAEVLSGRSFGAEGQVGLFKRSGWRVGAKKSAGFGNPIPVGSTVLTDSGGAPIYDAAGNIRYSQGATKPFRLGTDKDIGLGIYVG